MGHEFVQCNFCDFAAQGKTDRAQKTWDRIEQDNCSHKFSSQCLEQDWLENEYLYDSES